MCSVTVSDDDIVREIVHGCDPPRSTWVTGDNIYVSGLDMSWENFKIGDLLVMESGVVIVNTGYATRCLVCILLPDNIPRTMLIHFLYLPMTHVEQEIPTTLINVYFSQ